MGRKRNLTDEQIQEIIRLRKAGYKIQEICKIARVSPYSVSRYAPPYQKKKIYYGDVRLSNYGLDARRKLSDEDIKKVQELFEICHNLSHCARAYNVSASTIKYYVNADYREAQLTSAKKYRMTHGYIASPAIRQKSIEKKKHLASLANADRYSNRPIIFFNNRKHRKFTDSEFKELYEDFENGLYSNSELARKYDVSPSAIGIYRQRYINLKTEVKENV